MVDGCLFGSGRIGSNGGGEDDEGYEPGGGDEAIVTLKHCMPYLVYYASNVGLQMRDMMPIAGRKLLDLINDFHL
jgi:hypothetical protein